jgi:hypothetical protein
MILFFLFQSRNKSCGRINIELNGGLIEEPGSSGGHRSRGCRC